MVHSRRMEADNAKDPSPLLGVIGLRLQHLMFLFQKIWYEQVIHNTVLHWCQWFPNCFCPGWLPYPFDSKSSKWNFFEFYKLNHEIIVFFPKVEYLKYFDWKKEYKLFYQNPYCTICQKLHNKNEPVKMYPNISKWYYEDNEGKKQCTDGSERDYYKSFMTEK